jgi:hypothetical protein
MDTNLGVNPVIDNHGGRYSLGKVRDQPPTYRTRVALGPLYNSECNGLVCAFRCL